MPRELIEDMAAEAEGMAGAVHWVERPDRLLDPGDDVDGWSVELLRGHADGHIVLVREGTMIAGDTILTGITPAIGLYPNSRPDPLGDYLETLARFGRGDVRIAYTGHGSAVDDPAGRARTIAGHHAKRLDQAENALNDVPASAYAVSLALFDSDLSTTQRRFATAESLAHLERLVLAGRAERAGGGYAKTGI
jgi:glyoxylase-like metal-dependent hydrolase (beta-lactamase superfamily II)